MAENSEPADTSFGDAIQRRSEGAALKQVRRLTDALEHEQNTKDRKEKSAMVILYAVGAFTALLLLLLLGGINKTQQGNTFDASTVLAPVPAAAAAAKTSAAQKTETGSQKQ